MRRVLVLFVIRIASSAAIAGTYRADSDPGWYETLGADSAFNCVGQSWLANLKWSGNLSSGYDIGLVKLAQPVAGITPAVRYTGSSEIGQVGTFVGYGTTGTGLTGEITYDQVKRAGLNMIDSFYTAPGKQAPRIFLADFDNPDSAADNSFGSAIPLDHEYLIASGDSGGGAFLQIGDAYRLAGVHSFGWGRIDGNPDSDYGDVSGHTRVSEFNNWIDTTMAGSSGGRPPKPPKPHGLSAADAVRVDQPVAEPSVLFLAILGACGLIRRRRA